MRRLLVLLIALLAAPAFAQEPTPEQLRTQAERYADIARRTNDPAVEWLLAETYARLDQRENAVATLARAADWRVGFTVEARSPLSRFAGDPAYDAVVRRLNAAAAPLERSRVWAEVSAPELVPEGTAWDPAGRRLFLGDMHQRRILAVTQRGRARVFAQGLDLRPLGMTVDPARRRLWVATTDAFWDLTGPSRARLIAYDLRTGREIERLEHAQARSFNDVVVRADGALYATDSAAGGVWVRRAGRSELEPLVLAGSLGYPNGLALTPDGRTLIVAQGIALRRIDTATGAVTAIANPPGLSTMGVDGLYWRNGGLVAVQNTAPGRVLRITLSPNADAITGWTVLERNHPRFDTPTTGAIAGDRLLLLANSQLFTLRNDGTLDPERPLRPITILETPLD